MIYVFKTSVESEQMVQKITAQLDKFMPEAGWNFDLEDCDNVSGCREAGQARNRLLLFSIALAMNALSWSSFAFILSYVVIFE